MTLNVYTLKYKDISMKYKVYDLAISINILNKKVLPWASHNYIQYMCIFYKYL
jgi:hypothetical protein